MSKPLVIGVVVAVVGLFALGGFLLWQQLQPAPEQPVVQQTPPPAPLSQALDNPDWQSKIKSCIDKFSRLEPILPQIENYRADIDRKPIEL